MLIETMCFQLTDGANESAFVEADRKVQSDFAYQQPGLLRRTTGRGPDGAWIVIDLWRSEEDADACDRLWGRDDVTTQFMSFADTPTVRTER